MTASSEIRVGRKVFSSDDQRWHRWPITAQRRRRTRSWTATLLPLTFSAVLGFDFVSWFSHAASHPILAALRSYRDQYDGGSESTQARKSAFGVPRTASSIGSPEYFGLSSFVNRCNSSPIRSAAAAAGLCSPDELPRSHLMSSGVVMIEKEFARRLSLPLSGALVSAGDSRRKQIRITK